MNVADTNENLVPCPCCGEDYVEAGHKIACLTESERMSQLRAQKKFLRKEFLAKRAAVPQNERDRISHALIKKFLATEIYRKAKIIMAYASTPDELQLKEFFAVCFADKKILAIPFIVGKGKMQAVEVPNFDALELGEFNILTVKRELRKFIDPAKIDCVIVPGAAFDLSGGRLGLGGGYYDKFLPLAVNAKKIALAYDFQLVDNLPLENHDVKIDGVLTIGRSICHEVW